jgi:protein-S-isoprenylcysteine O-methyltransferase Ste14
MLDSWLRVRDHLSEALFGGPRVLKMAWVIDLQKGGTLPFVLALMAWFDVWTATAWTYAALHGSYGLLWLMKDRFFPDPNWEKRVTFGAALAALVLVLGPYWVAPVILVTQRVEASPALLAAATVLYVLGAVTMMVADAHKYFVLKVKRGLITDGLFGLVRHPNYLGEMMLYASFAVIVGHPVPWAILAFVWTTVFLPNMLRKEARMARHPEWESYRARTGMLLPRLRLGGGG